MKFGGKSTQNNNIDVCHYLSPECIGQNYTNCSYWDGDTMCPQSQNYKISWVTKSGFLKEKTCSNKEQVQELILDLLNKGIENFCCNR